ncbi:MAG: hypothetical protein GXY38_09810 [Planctomycetes bacterium]|jgi:hypothetical protein|nr:hypothetical protein [Planctomycetota bacterium]
MKPSVIDRFLVTGLACAISAACGCLVLLWPGAFDTSGQMAMISIASLLAATCVASLIPHAIMRVFPRAGGRRDSALLASVGMPAAVDARMDNRLLAASSVFCGVCILATFGTMHLAGMAADEISRRLLLHRWAWLAIAFFLQTVAMLPAAAALMVAFIASAAIRGGGGTDPYASGTRNWTAGLGGGMLLLALIWRCGMDLRASAAAIGVLLPAAGAFILARKHLSIRPPRPPTEIAGQSPPPRRWSVWPMFTAAALFGGFQCRIAADVLGAGLDLQVAWIGVTLVIMTRALAREDHHPAPPAVCVPALGLAAGAPLQTALALTVLWLDAKFHAPLVLLAALAQVPLCSLAAIIISKQRRSFAAGGANASSYLARAAMGLSLGALIILVAGSLWAARLAVIVAVLAVAASAAWSAINRTQRWNEQIAWAVLAACLLLTASSSAVIAFVRSAGAVGPVTVDGWFTVGRDGWIMGERNLPQQAAVSAAQAEFLTMIPQASWLVVNPGQTVHGRGFDGVTVSSLRADHHQAWRLFNVETLAGYQRRTSGGGSLLMIRTQASADNVAPALAAARTLLEVTGSGYMAFDVNENGIDLLAIGPMDQSPQIEAPARLLPLSALQDFENIAPISLHSPSCLYKQRITADALRKWRDR